MEWEGHPRLMMWLGFLAPPAAMWMMSHTEWWAVLLAGALITPLAALLLIVPYCITALALAGLIATVETLWSLLHPAHLDP